MFGGSTANFSRLVDKATSQLLLEPDWDSTLQICDCIRQGDVQAKYCVQILKKKISQENPHVSLYALQVLESCVKNCGVVIHEEVAIKEFMEFLKDLVTKRPDPVKAKILELVQVWSHAFRNEPSYKIVPDTFQLMKMEGYTFPTLKEADAMFKAEKAPEWKDGECCNKCRVQYSMFQRKHHCRHCGNIFCAKCSSKTSIIPKFGLEREVRVCDSCFDDIAKNAEGGKRDDDGLPSEYLNSPLSQQAQVKNPQTPATKTEQEIQEEDELQLALALSMSEAQAKDKERSRRSNYSYTGGSGDSNTTANNATHAQPVKVAAPAIDTSDMAPELARYLNRNYWQQKHEEVKTSTTTPSAPVAVAESKTSMVGGSVGEKVEEKYQNGETSDDEVQFLGALRSSVEIFVNRMRSNHSRGRSIATDSSVQTLFMTINAMHPQLIKQLSELEDSRSHYEILQDKLAQLKDARDALDALRDEHREKRRREQEELERQRQIQMSHKLEILRQKKQEYLEYQRQLALQRMHEQEREMHYRLEQQKQLQQMRAMQYRVPQMYNQPQSFSPGGSAEGSPLHQPYPGGATVGGPGTYPQAPGVVPVAPGAPGPQIPQGAQVPPGSIAPPPTQTMYTQPGYQAPPQQVPGGYQQPPPGGYPATTYMGGVPPGQFPGGQAPGQPGTLPGPAAPPQPGPAAPPQGDYHSYNMQNMANTLPSQGQPGLPPPGAAVPQQYMAPPQGHYVPPGAQPLAQQPGQPAAQQQPPPMGQNEAQLISFD